MSRFKKLLYTLLFILIIEIILIYLGNKYNILSLNNGSNNKSTCILVDISSHELFLINNNKIIKSYTIASGKPNTPSPIGSWKIISKGTWGKGFGGHWLGLNVPWGKYGIHGTNKPNSIGWNSSHGCIRMKNRDVSELYKLVPHGTPVIIHGGPYGNFGSRLRNINPGDRGADVFEVQRLLKIKGYYEGNPDGIYGDGMKYYIHKFQKDNNIPLSNTINFNFYKKLGVKLMD
jgi:hypothetical protein